MKRLIIIFLAATALLFVSGSQCLADDGPAFGFHKMYHHKTEISLYVNGATGQDKHGHGRFPHKPYQTISFALEAMPLVRKSADIRVTIHVAAGTHNENLYIRLDNIIIQGEGRDVTTIMGNEVDDAVEIFNAKRIRLIGLKITNGYNGINTSFASLICDHISLIDNKNHGLSANNNSYVRLDNVVVSDNDSNGVNASRASTVRIYGGVFSENRRGLYGSRNSIADILPYSPTNRAKFENNDREGLYANTGTVIRIEDADVNKNKRDGISANLGSIVRLNGGNLISENDRSGIAVHDNSYLSSHGDDSIYDNDLNGVSLGLESTARFHNQTAITDNYEWGIYCVFDDMIVGPLPGTLSGNFKHHPDYPEFWSQTNCLY